MGVAGVHLWAWPQGQKVTYSWPKSDVRWAKMWRMRAENWRTGQNATLECYNGLLSPLLCAGLWSWTTYNLAERVILDPSRGLQNGSTKLCTAQHVPPVLDNKHFFHVTHVWMESSNVSYICKQVFHDTTNHLANSICIQCVLRRG